MNGPRRRSSIVLAVALAGCAGRPPRPAGPELDPATTARALADLARPGEPVRFDGEARVSGRRRGVRFRARVLVRAELGGRLRLEAGPPAPFVLAADGAEVRALLPDRRQWLRAPASPATVDRLVGVPLAPDEIVALLDGSGAPPERLAGARAGTGGRVALSDGELRLDARGRVAAGRIREVEFERDPERSTLALRSRRLRLDMRVRLRPAPQPQPPGPAAGALFRPDPPPGFAEAVPAAGEEPLLLGGGQ